jgi:hypothetical protein
LKGFRSYFHSPFLDFSWRYRDELPPSHPSSPEVAMWIGYRSEACMSGLEAKVCQIFLQRGRQVLDRDLS